MDFGLLESSVEFASIWVNKEGLRGVKVDLQRQQMVDGVAARWRGNRGEQACEGGGQQERILVGLLTEGVCWREIFGEARAELRGRGVSVSGER